MERKDEGEGRRGREGRRIVSEDCMVWGVSFLNYNFFLIYRPGGQLPQLPPLATPLSSMDIYIIIPPGAQNSHGRLQRIYEDAVRI
jgi:hypothetical protein